MKLRLLKKLKVVKQTKKLFSVFFKTEAPKETIANCKRELKIIAAYLSKRKKINFVDPPKEISKHLKLHGQITIYKTGVLEDKILAQQLARNDLTVVFFGDEKTDKNTSKFLTKYMLLRKPVLTVTLKTFTNINSRTKPLNPTKIEVFNCVLSQ